jgi:hypothetical protein
VEYCRYDACRYANGYCQQDSQHRQSSGRGKRLPNDVTNRTAIVQRDAKITLNCTPYKTPVLHVPRLV